MNKEKFVEKHSENFKKMANKEIEGFETKKYFVKNTLLEEGSNICSNCDLNRFCGNGCPGGQGVVKITKKEKTNA